MKTHSKRREHVPLTRGSNVPRKTRNKTHELPNYLFLGRFPMSKGVKKIMGPYRCDKVVGCDPDVTKKSIR